MVKQIEPDESAMLLTPIVVIYPECEQDNLLEIKTLPRKHERSVSFSITKVDY